MTEITVQLTLDDYLIYNDFHIANSKVGKRMSRIFRIAVPVALIAYGLLMNFFLRVDGWQILIVAALIWAVIAPYLFVKINRMKVKKWIKDKDNGDMFAERTYTLDELGISSQSENISSKFKWDSVVEFCEDGSSFYIYLSSIQAVVIPKRCFVQGDEMRFRDQVRKYMI